MLNVLKSYNAINLLYIFTPANKAIKIRNETLNKISHIYVEFAKRIDIRRLSQKDVKMIMSYEKKQ